MRAFFTALITLVMCALAVASVSATPGLKMKTKTMQSANLRDNLPMCEVPQSRVNFSQIPQTWVHFKDGESAYISFCGYSSTSCGDGHVTVFDKHGKCKHLFQNIYSRYNIAEDPEYQKFIMENANRDHRWLRLDVQCDMRVKNMTGVSIGTPPEEGKNKYHLMSLSGPMFCSPYN